MFTKFHNVTNIYLENKLLIKENVLLEPSKRNLRGIAQFEEYTHKSNLLFLKDNVDIGNLMQMCRQFLSQNDDIEFGISELPANGFRLSILGYKGEQLFNCHSQLALMIQRAVDPALCKI